MKLLNFIQKGKISAFTKKIYWLSGKRKAENGRRFILLTLLCSLLPALLFSQYLETTIYVPDSLSGMAYPQAFIYNATNNKIYVGGEYGNCVIVIDGETNQKIARIPAGEDIHSLCWNSTNNKVYCANYGSDNVTVIDGATNQVITTISVGDWPRALVWNSTNNNVYCANEGSNNVTVIDGATNQVIATIQVGDGPRALVWNSTNNKVYCANEGSNNVTVIDGATNQVIATIPVGDSSSALVWNSTNNKVYCANEGSNNVSVIDGATNQVITTIPVGSAPCAFAWNSIQNRTYVANYGSSSISVIRDVTGIEEYFIPDVKPLTSEIYPNPANSFFVIRSSLPVKEIEIFDVSGKLIKEIAFSSAKEPKISLKGIKTGIYLLKIKAENKEFTEKLIIR
uniref:T9SS type A sorting domain-containing protein n=1 Tax=candidate division WOR-3 bacterium TaxID=2052148 RepID=A0A7C3UVU9_UNCW3